MKMLVKTKDEWKDYLQDAQRKGAEAIIEFGKRVYEYKLECETVSGGSTFAQDIKEWLGISQSAGSRWCKIGQENSKLIHSVNKLPQSWGSIYLISTLEDSNIQNAIDEKVINPQTTRNDIKNFKNRLVFEKKHKKEQEKRAKADADFKPTKKSIKDDIEKARQSNKVDKNIEEKVKEKIKRKIKEEMDKEKENKNNKKTESKYSDDYTWYDEHSEKFYNSIKNLFEGNNELRDPENKEDAYLMIGKLLMAADDNDLNKYIFKTLKQRLHPDRFLGDSELFKYISKIEEKINV